MALHIVAEANRCLNCKKPRCQQGCPVHTPIPMVIQLFKENRLMEAGQMLFENNPMSAVCAIVCNHEKQCAGNCIRGIKETPPKPTPCGSGPPVLRRNQPLGPHLLAFARNRGFFSKREIKSTE